MKENYKKEKGKLWKNTKSMKNKNNHYCQQINTSKVLIWLSPITSAHNVFCTFSSRRMAKATLFLVVLLGVPNIFPFLINRLVVYIGEEALFVINFIFVNMNNIQGLMVATLYVLCNTEVRTEVRNRIFILFSIILLSSFLLHVVSACLVEANSTIWTQLYIIITVCSLYLLAMYSGSSTNNIHVLVRKQWWLEDMAKQKVILRFQDPLPAQVTSILVLLLFSVSWQLNK